MSCEPLPHLFPNSLVVASCVTPTDPILAQAVVGGPWAEKHVPAHLRHMLMCESGCNDGAAFPFLYLALFLTTNRDNTGKAIAEWFYDALAYQIIFGTILGALIGWAARKLMRFSERHKLVDRESFVAQYVSLAIASMGVNVLLGSDDLLAAFACGSAFAWDGWFTKQTEDSNFSSIVDLLFNVAVFVYIGALMPYRQWAGGSEGEPNTLSIWRLFVLAICVLLTKRIPIVLALWRWIPDIKTFREAIFAGHFGPIGVGAVFIATLARTQLPEEVANPPETSNDILALTVQPVIYFFVLCSIAVHGLTIPFFAFSKGATRMTRTWSRHPSFALDREPTWVNRIRRMRSKDGEAGEGDENGGMSEIERVLNAQLRQVGRGAIGGDAEKDFDRFDSGQGTGESSETAAVAGEVQKTPRGESAENEYDGNDVPERSDPFSDDWDGDDTVEARRYKEKLLAKKQREYQAMRAQQNGHDEEKRTGRAERQAEHEDGDVGTASMMDEERGAMDRDIPRTNKEKAEALDKKAAYYEEKEKRLEQTAFAGLRAEGARDDSSERQEREHAAVRNDNEDGFPQSRSWVEGDKIVIEYQKSACSDVEVQVIPLMEHEREEIAASDQPGHTWAVRHADAIEQHVGLEGVGAWHPSEALHNLVSNRIPTLYNEYLKRGRRPARRGSVAESAQARNERSSMMMDAMSWASQRRDPEEDKAPSARDAPARKFLQSSSSGSVRQKPSYREETPSPPPVTGWLAPRPSGKKPRKPSRAGPDVRERSTSPGSSDAGGRGARCAKQHRLASDTRRRNTTRRVLAGRLALLHPGQPEQEEVFEAPDGPSHRGIGFPRSLSAGGLGASRPTKDSSSSSSSGGTAQMTPSSSSQRLGVPSVGFPRTLSASDDNSRALSGRERLQSERGGHSRATSVQWLDIADTSHDHDLVPTGDPGRLSGLHNRPLSRVSEREHGTSSPVRRTGSLRGQADPEGASDDGGGGIERGGRRMGRLANFFTSLAPGRSNRDTQAAPSEGAESNIPPAEAGDADALASSRMEASRSPSAPTVEQPEPLSLRVPTKIVGAASGPSEGGGILSGGAGSTDPRTDPDSAANLTGEAADRNTDSAQQRGGGQHDSDRDRVTFDV